jgi:hypothetical protein
MQLAGTRATTHTQRRHGSRWPLPVLSAVLVLLLCVGALAQSPEAAAVPSEIEVRQSVEAAREALDRGLIARQHPWYDEDNDGVRRIRIKIPKPPSNWSWGNPNLSWLGQLFEVYGWLLFGLFVLALMTGLLLAYLKRDRQSDGAVGAAMIDEETSDIDRVEALPFRMGRQTTEPLTEARRAYEAGDFNEAIVYLFSYQLIELDRQQIIRLARSKTNRQCVGEIGSRRMLRQLVEQTMVAFEDVFFGGHSLSRARFEACWLRLDDFGRLVMEGQP